MAEKSQAKIPEVLLPEKVDEQLVDEAAKYIHDKLQETVAKGLIEIGQYVFTRFFDGKVERVTSKDPMKAASFAKLAERCGTPDLPVSKTWLHGALWIAVTAQELGPKSPFNELPPSHQTVLLLLRHKDDFELIEKAAAKAIERKLPVKKLRAFVQAEAAKAPKSDKRPGRPPKKLIVRTLDRSLKVFTFEAGKRSFTKADVDALSDEETKNALKAAEKLAASLQDLIKKLEKKN